MASVVIFHNGYGDYVLALPALRALAATLPRPSLLVAGDGPQSFIVADAGFDQCAFLPFTRQDDGTEFDWRAVLAWTEDCAVLVALCPWPSAALGELHRALRPRRSIGFGPPCAELLDYRADAHECDVLFGPVRLLDPAAVPADFSAPMHWPPRTAGVAAALRSALPPGGRLLVAHLDTVPGKSWPVGRLDQVLATVIPAHPALYVIVLNAAAAELPLAGASGRVTGLQGLALDRAMSVAAAADLFVGVDSCMLHVADLHRRPGVGLFAGTAPARFGFRWTAPEHVRYVRAAAMEDIGPEPVTAALRELLAGGGQDYSWNRRKTWSTSIA